MDKLSNPNRDYLSGFLLFIAIFMCAGWYFAEQENETLREEQAVQSFEQHVHHHEDK